MLALDCLLARLYANHVKTTISFRDLARQFGGNHMTYKRAYEKTAKRMREVQALAIARRTPYFQCTGLVASEDDVQQSA
ncbi:hypothetical protein [Burkholderia sp. Nafp2/4-1b]|uniref:hypothetical protein n=1 Tax=Burkholderia sp. Nafp2/4-1b TaxID=2116686 RepID=UPI001969E20A|nr:hypothetical protein [Burkholderia sp. Nafp2/4-1b]